MLAQPGQAAMSFGAAAPPEPLPAVSESGLLVNDVHSRLNATRVDRMVRVDSLPALQAALRSARREKRGVCVAGGRHSMGGQPFGDGMVLLDTGGLNRVLRFDDAEGTVEVESGILWPDLVRDLLARQAGGFPRWGIAQKQTGADRLSLGGALAANIHGRGLKMRPIIGDVEAFTLVGPDGAVRRCSRWQHSELFRLVIGGYGLFGIVYSVKLRPAARKKLERIVRVLEVDDVMEAFAEQIREGALYGDFQFSCDQASDDLLRKGVFSCYRPAGDGRSVPDGQRELSEQDWKDLVYLAHADKGEAFRRYADRYLSTSGQVYWSDTHQLSLCLDDYHRELDVRLAPSPPGSEVITELFVPRERFLRLMAEVRRDLRCSPVSLIYGTVRLIEADHESFLAWAREAWACVVLNLHVEHTARGMSLAVDAFRGLIDRVIGQGGCYYLAYHRHATLRQVERCYPQLPAFLRLKERYDPEGRLQSDWCRHYTARFAHRRAGA